MRALETSQPPLRRLLRTAGVALLAGLGAAAAIQGPSSSGWFLAWLILNILLVLAAAAWGLVHPRALLPAAALALRVAFWLALLGTLAGFAWFETLLAVSLGVRIPGGFSLLFGLAAGFGLFLALLAANFLAASLGAFTGRRRAEPEAAGRLGIGCWWAAAFLATLAGSLLAKTGVPIRIDAGLLAGVPLGAAGLAALARRPGWGPRQLVDRGLHGLAARLVWRWRWRGRDRLLDLRGGALGLTGGLLALTLAAAGLLDPLRTRVLAGLIQARNATPWQALDEASDSTAPYERIVLLELDDAAQRAALADGSEAALQAAVLTRMAGWGATRIVLPAPRLHLPSAVDWEMSAGAGQSPPLLSQGAVDRCVRDLPALAAAMQHCGNVTLALDDSPLAERLSLEEGAPVGRGGPFAPEAPTQEERQQLHRLRAAGRETGSAVLVPIGAAPLPAIPARWSGPAPVPLLLLAAARGRALGPPEVGVSTARIAGQELPLIVADRILVDFIGTQPGRAFARVPYTSVMGGGRIYDSPFRLPFTAPGPEGTYRSPAEFFRGKIVFLDQLAGRGRETPIGVMTSAELLAHATATLLGARAVSAEHPGEAILWALLVAAVVGQLCARRDPFAASWRLAVVLFLLIAPATLSFAFDRTWMDPVVPVAGAVGAFLLATQLTFTLERNERERNRRLLRHFVAPQVVEELLEEMMADPDRLGLGGKRQWVSVLFADVRGFTRFTEQHHEQPEEVMRVINAYMTALTEAVFAHGGILDKYTGDGLMALFRLQEPDSTEVGRSVRAALSMRVAAERISAERAVEGLPPLRVGIGLHCGEAVVGLVGNPDHFNYTALGLTVVVSHRLQALAAGGEVVVSETVYRAIAGEFDAEPGEPVPVKGISEPVRPYRILGPADGSATPLPAAGEWILPAAPGSMGPVG